MKFIAKFLTAAFQDPFLKKALPLNTDFDNYIERKPQNLKTGATKTALPQSHRISLQDAQDRKLFGPVYHGTTSAGRKAIDTGGFKIFEGEEGSGDIRNGYRGNQAYSLKHPGVPALFITLVMVYILRPARA